MNYEEALRKLKMLYPCPAGLDYAKKAVDPRQAWETCYRPDWSIYVPPEKTRAEVVKALDELSELLAKPSDQPPPLHSSSCLPPPGLPPSDRGGLR